MVKKSLMILFGLMVSFSLFAQPVNSLVHDNSSLIDDYANIYTPQQKQELYNILKPFFDTVQIVVVTVNSLDGMDKQEYATKLFNRWGVGSKSNNGLLLLIAPKERKSFAATGKGIQGELTDLQAARLQRELMVPEFKNKNYFEGTKKVLLAYIDVLSPSAKEYREKQEQADIVQTTKMFYGFMYVILFGACMAMILLLIRSYRRAKSKKRERESNIISECNRNISKLIQIMHIVADEHSGASAVFLFDIKELHKFMDTAKEIQDIKDANARFYEFMSLNAEDIASYKRNVDVYSSAISEYNTSKNLSKECDSIITGLIDKCSNLIFASSDSLLDTLKQLRVEFIDTLDKLGKSLSEGTPSLSTQIVYNRAVELKRKRTLFIAQRDSIKNEIKTDNAKCLLAKDCHRVINERCNQLLAYCYKSGVGEYAIRKTKEAIAEVKQRLESSSYHRMSIVSQYELYSELEQALSSKDCQLAKTEYEKAEDIKREKIRKELNEAKKMNEAKHYGGDAMSGNNESISYAPNYSRSDYSDSGSTSTSSSNDLGGGSSDGGGGGSDW